MLDFLLATLVLIVIAGMAITGLWMMVTPGKRRVEDLEAPPPLPMTPAQKAVFPARLPSERWERRYSFWRFLKGLILTGPAGVLGWAIYDFLSTPWDFGGSKGRLLRIRNRAVLPPPMSSRDWPAGDVPEVDALSEIERAVLRDLWLLSARMEHASIAAFSQLSLHLAALGAPPALLQRTHEAALDEIRHARRSFAIASAYGGSPVGAGAIAELAQPGKVEAIDFTRLAIGTLVDGCLAEGLAAAVARHAADRATDRVVRETLAMVSEDEGRHAELAWSILAWSLDQGGPATAQAVAARVAGLDRELSPALPDLHGVDLNVLADHGVSAQTVLGELAVGTIEQVRNRASVLLLNPVRAAA